MRLLSEEMLQDLPSLSDISCKFQPDLVFYYRLYNPIGLGDWLVVAKELVEDEVKVIVLELLDEVVYKRFSLKEFREFKFHCGQRIKRDDSFKRMTLAELRENIHILV